MITKKTSILFLIVEVFCVIILVSACSQKIQYSRYDFTDDPYRYIVMTFHQDGSLELSNSVGLSLGFWGYGYWKLISDNEVFVTINNVTDTVDHGNASPQGVPINSDSAMYDRSYIFPLVYCDTETFSENHKIAYLKGYEFSLFKKSKNFSKFIVSFEK